MKKLFIASKNKGKIHEFIKLLPNMEIISLIDYPELEDVEETGKTFNENAFLKANSIKIPNIDYVIGDDSGLCIEGLNGFPGIFSARWVYPETDYNIINKMLIEKMKNENLFLNNNSLAYLYSSLCLIDNKRNKIKYFDGKIIGSISEIPKGNKGFGYDPIFIPLGENKTFGEMSDMEKSIFSHRNIAIKKLIQYLKD